MSSLSRSRSSWEAFQHQKLGAQPGHERITGTILGGRTGRQWKICRLGICSRTLSCLGGTPSTRTLLMGGCLILHMGVCILAKADGLSILSLRTALMRTPKGKAAAEDSPSAALRPRFPAPPQPHHLQGFCDPGPQHKFSNSIWLDSGDLSLSPLKAGP